MRWATVERLRTIGWATVTLLALVAAFVMVRGLLQQGPAPGPHAETTITQVMLPPPPPPPPLPPKEEPQKIEQVQPKEQTPMQAKPLAKAPPSKAPSAPPGNPLTAQAGPGPNQYGLALGNGGGDAVGGGGGGDPFGYFNGVVAARVRQLLSQNEKTRYGSYVLTASIWVSDDGQIQRAQLISSTGDAVRDAAIEQSLTGASIGEAMPSGMPQPIRMRIGARAPG